MLADRLKHRETSEQSNNRTLDFAPTLFGCRQWMEVSPSKQLSPPGLAAEQGQNWGMGVRHALFPGLALGAKLAASFPTPFSTASGVCRPHSRAVQSLAAAGLLSEAS